MSKRLSQCHGWRASIDQVLSGSSKICVNAWSGGYDQSSVAYVPMSPLTLVLIIAANIVVGGLICRPCFAQQRIVDEVPQLAGANEAVAFDIPAQPLISALSSYGAATRVQLFVDAALMSGRFSTAVKGTFSPADALKALLTGTGLEAAAVSNRGFTLTALPISAHSSGMPAEASIGALRFNAYSGMIQHAMRDVLCRYEQTRTGPYRLVTRLWIGASGLVTRAELISSTGDISRDNILSGSFHELSIGSPPPAGLPQPVTLLIDRDETQSGYCERARSSIRRVEWGERAQ